MAEAKAPIDVIGTGSYPAGAWSETYATADIIAYDGEPRVKVGREFLLQEIRQYAALHPRTTRRAMKSAIAWVTRGSNSTAHALVEAVDILGVGP